MPSPTNPARQWWGIHFVLSSAFDLPGAGPWLRFIDVEYVTHGRYVIMAASLGLGVWGRWSKRSAIEVAALAFAMFLFLAPGIGVQYFVLLVPVLVMTDLRRAAIWGLVAGLFVSAVYVYYHDEWFPFRSLHRGLIPTSIAVDWVSRLWLLLLEFIWSRVRQLARLPPDTGERRARPGRRVRGGATVSTRGPFHRRLLAHAAKAVLTLSLIAH